MNLFGLLIFNFNFSYVPLDNLKMYDKHLQSKDAVYDLIMRSVKFITNFAQTG